MDGRIVTERSIITGHVEVADGLIYFPYQAPMIANGLGRPTQYATGTPRMRQRTRSYDMVSR
jgi:hypothetical protein